MSYKNLLSLFIISVFFNCNQVQNSNIENHLNSEIHTINNDTIAISIKSRGAELSSFKRNEKEYLWQGDSLFWHEQSPILFPIVGKLKDDTYSYDGKNYKMKFHGFARAEIFNVITKSKNSITFSLKTNDRIKKQYPFNFELQLIYTLKNNSLIVEYNVINLSNTEAMYYSIGAHPGFNCPLEENHEQNEYQLVFDAKANPVSLDKSGGLFNDKYTQYFKESGILKLQDTTFRRGALVFKPNPFNKATLVHQPTNKAYLSVRFEGFPYLGIWSARKKDTPFVCIEPWYGLADFANHNKDLTKKQGIQKLDVNSTFKASYQIQIH